MNPFRSLPRHLRKELRKHFPGGAALWVPKLGPDETKQRHDQIYRQFLTQRAKDYKWEESVRRTARAESVSYSLVCKIVAKRRSKKRFSD